MLWTFLGKFTSMRQHLQERTWQSLVMASLFLCHVLDCSVVWRLAQLWSPVSRTDGLFSRNTGTNRWVDVVRSSYGQVLWSIFWYCSLRHRKVKKTLVFHSEIAQESQMSLMIHRRKSIRNIIEVRKIESKFIATFLPIEQKIGAGKKYRFQASGHKSLRLVWNSTLVSLK